MTCFYDKSPLVIHPKKIISSNLQHVNFPPPDRRAVNSGSHLQEEEDLRAGVWARLKLADRHNFICRKNLPSIFGI